MKQTIRLNESQFNRLVKETLKRVLREVSMSDEDEPKQNRGDIEMIHHTSKAFAPGDKILYWRSVSGAKSAKFVATVTAFDGLTLTVDENGTERKYQSNSGNIKSNSSWLRPLKHFCTVVYKNTNALPPYKDYVINYEPSSDGRLYITILDKPKQTKYYYTKNGEFVKTVSVNMLHASKFKGKPGIPDAVKANTTQPLPGYVDLDEDWILVDKFGKFYAWNYDKIDEIVENCPWLKEMDAKWKSVGWDKTKKFNPFV